MEALQREVTNKDADASHTKHVSRVQNKFYPISTSSSSLEGKNWELRDLEKQVFGAVSSRGKE